MSILMRYAGWPYRVMPREIRQMLGRDWPFSMWTGDQTAYPPVNVYENSEAVVMEFELPGVPRENVDLTTTDTSVTLKVNRPVEGEIPPEKYHVRERLRGEFGRTVTVPAKVDSAEAKASYEKGILTVVVPKKDEAKSRRIEIQAG